MRLTSPGTKKLDLSWETTQFMDMCKQQSKFDSTLHSLNVTTIRAYVYPAWALLESDQSSANLLNFQLGAS